MIKKVFAIYDKAVRAYTTPFFMNTYDEAIRAVKGNLDTNQMWKDNPEDFKLVYLGAWDDCKGEFKQAEPETIGHFTEWLPSDEVTLEAVN